MEANNNEQTIQSLTSRLQFYEPAKFPDEDKEECKKRFETHMGEIAKCDTNELVRLIFTKGAALMVTDGYCVRLVKDKAELPSGASGWALTRRQSLMTAGGPKYGPYIYLVGDSANNATNFMHEVTHFLIEGIYNNNQQPWPETWNDGDWRSANPKSQRTLVSDLRKAAAQPQDWYDVMTDDIVAKNDDLALAFRTAIEGLENYTAPDDIAMEIIPYLVEMYFALVTRGVDPNGAIKKLKPWNVVMEYFDNEFLPRLRALDASVRSPVFN